MHHSSPSYLCYHCNFSAIIYVCESIVLLRFCVINRSREDRRDPEMIERGLSKVVRHTRACVHIMKNEKFYDALSCAYTIYTYGIR